ncbi:thioredoxin-disulfide reductase, partial [Candidatus Curtissbacteria bacterium RIFCSPLOWO2_12_FULL_38_9]
MDNVRNVIIIGSGPAGLTAALYLSRANLKPLLIAGSKWGGQLMLTTDVENYPGFPKGIQGPDLMKNFRDQAERFGTEIMDSDVTTVDFKVRPFKVKVSDRSYLTKSVIIASGADTRWLGLPNEKRLIGKGVSSCAPCDAFFFKDKRVIVAGGGDSAMEEALTLTKFASDVKIVHRREAFRASKIMVDRAKANKKISFILNSEVVDVLGRDKVEGVKINNKVDNKTSDILVDGIFVAIGHIPVTNLFQGQVDLDIKGYVMRKAKIHFGDPDAPGNYKMMTSTEGV